MLGEIHDTHTTFADPLLQRVVPDLLPEPARLPLAGKPQPVLDQCEDDRILTPVVQLAELRFSLRPRRGFESVQEFRGTRPLATRQRLHGDSYGLCPPR